MLPRLLYDQDQFGTPELEQLLELIEVFRVDEGYAGTAGFIAMHLDRGLGGGNGGFMGQWGL